MAISAMLSAALLLPMPVAAGVSGSTFNVTKTADTADGSCTLQDCSLREAIIAANATVDYDIINVPRGRYVLSIPGTGEQASATGDLDILAGVDIHGAGARKTIIDGGGIDRVFNVPYTGTSTLFDVWMENVTITGGFIENEIGGGIWMQEPSGTFHLLKSTVRGNRAYQGGGIGNGYQWETTMIIDRSTINGNRAPGGQGGGIQNVGALTIINSTISGNRSLFAGALINAQGSVDIQYSTIAFNVAQQPGGGIMASGGVTVEGSIIAKNSSAFAFGRNCYGAMISHGHNLENGDTCGMDETSDLHGKPHLDPLGSYGGPTKTHRLRASSPAINAGGGIFPLTDQRGVSRPRNLVPDIGSYER